MIEKLYVSLNGNLKEVPEWYYWGLPLISGLATLLIFFGGLYLIANV